MIDTEKQALDSLILENQQLLQKVSRQAEDLAQKDKAIFQIEKVVSQQAEDLAQKDKTIFQIEKVVFQQAEDLAQKDKAISQKDKAISQKDKAISQKDKAISQKDETISQKDEILSQQQSTIAQMAYRIKELERMKFGHSRERFVSDPNQLNLFNEPKEEAVEQAAEEAKAEIAQETITYTRRKSSKRGEGIEFSGDVEEEHIYFTPKESVEGMVEIGEEITEKIEYCPAKIKKTIYLRKKFITPEDAVGNCRQIMASLPHEIDKCMASVSLLANIAVSKYIDHLPLYRQLKIFERHGVHIPTSTFESWIKICSDTLRPLYNILKMTVLLQDYLQVDESPIPVLDRDHPGSTKRGFMWVYHSVAQKMVFFEYQKGRSGKFPKENLKAFKGFLQTDGYSGYKQFELNKDITHLGCWAHVRRKFEHAKNNDYKHASEVMLWIQKLYDVEREATELNLNPEEIKALRLEKSLPTINLIGKYIYQERTEVLPKSPIGKAFDYYSDRYTTLSNYLYNGNLKIDDNLVENAIRPLALGRKNYLFAGSHERAEDVAMYYSFFATCRLNEVNPEEWLTFVLGHINDAKPSQYLNLLPSNFHPDLFE